MNLYTHSNAAIKKLQCDLCIRNMRKDKESNPYTHGITQKYSSKETTHEHKY